VDLYIAFIVGFSMYSSMDHSQFYLQITPYLPLPRKRSPDGATTDWWCRHL